MSEGVLVLLMEAVATAFDASDEARRDARGLLEAFAHAVDAAEHFDDAQDGERPAREAVNDGLLGIASSFEALAGDVSGEARQRGAAAIARMIRTGVDGQEQSFGPYPLTTRAWLEEADAKTASLHEETYRAVLGALLPGDRGELVETAAQIGLLAGRLGQLRDDAVEAEQPLLVGDHVFSLAWLAEVDDDARSALAGEVTPATVEALRVRASERGASAHARVLAERLLSGAGELVQLLVGAERARPVLDALRASVAESPLAQT